MIRTHSPNSSLAETFWSLIYRLNARKLASTISLLLHVAVIVWAFTSAQERIGMSDKNTYIEVGLKTLPTAKPRRAKTVRKAVAKPKPKPQKKPEPQAKAEPQKPKEKPVEKGPVDLDKLATEIAEVAKSPPPPAPIQPARPEPKPAPPVFAPLPPQSGAPSSDAQASLTQESSLLGVLPDWCPQDEALISATVQEPELRTLYDIYIGSIKNRVSDNWYIPPVLAADAKCTIFIEQLVSGDIVRYEFAFCSGGDDFRNSVEQAIRRTTLPIPPDRRLYSRCIGFDFIPSEF